MADAGLGLPRRRAAGRPGSRARLVLAGVAVLLAAALVLAPAAQRRWQARQQAALGERLLQGIADDSAGGAATVPRGRLAGHAGELPTAATRCVNCHAIGDAGATGTGTAAFGPLLAPGTLARSLPRRGGPPSRYDAASLCRLLRDGIDPAWVVVDQAMPRYDVDDAQCEAMWARLMRPSRAS